MASNWNFINGLLGIGRAVFNNHHGVHEQFFERAKNEKRVEMKSPDMITKSGLQQDYPPALPVLSFEGNISFPDYFFMPSPKLINRSQRRSRYTLSASVTKKSGQTSSPKHLAPNFRARQQLDAAFLNFLAQTPQFAAKRRRRSTWGRQDELPSSIVLCRLLHLNHILPPKPCPKLSYSSIDCGVQRLTPSKRAHGGRNRRKCERPAP